MIHIQGDIYLGIQVCQEKKTILKPEGQNYQSKSDRTREMLYAVAERHAMS
jgi:hypothetical protein